jgi:hypothetical protein
VNWVTAEWLISYFCGFLYHTRTDTSADRGLFRAGKALLASPATLNSLRLERYSSRLTLDIYVHSLPGSLGSS